MGAVVRADFDAFQRQSTHRAEVSTAPCTSSVPYTAPTDGLLYSALTSTYLAYCAPYGLKLPPVRPGVTRKVRKKLRESVSYTQCPAVSTRWLSEPTMAPLHEYLRVTEERGDACL